MTSSLLLKGSTVLHAIALTVALALVSSNYNGHKDANTNQMTEPVLQVQPASADVAIAPKLVSP